MKEGFVEVDGVRLHYVEAGEGPPLVFVHGWGLNCYSWDAQVRFFADRFRVIAYDWRGHGRSDSTPAFLFSALGRELDGVLTQLGAERPLLCGHSMGGTIVMEYATTHDRPLAGLLLIDTNIPGSRWDRLVHWLRCHVGAFGPEALARVLGPRRTLALLAPVYGRTFWDERWRQAHPKEYSAWRGEFTEAFLFGMTRAYRASARRTDPEPRLRELSLPVLVVNGTADRVFPVHMARRISAAVKGSTLSLVENAGHMSMCEQPDQVNACMDAFLRTIPR